MSQKVYEKDGAYTKEIRHGFQETIEQSKEKFPNLFKKNKINKK
jgi:hypothetical protein